MAEDPYKVLGVARTASDDEIRRAYRALAKKYHPDLHPGDKSAEDRFKSVTAAYDLLRDADKRARFDRGELDAAGQERPTHGYYRYSNARRSAGAGAGGGAGTGAGGFSDFSDLFSDLFAGFGRGQAEEEDARNPRRKARGADVRYQLSVDFLDSVRGATKRVAMPDGKTLDVSIPPGIQDGATLRLKGQGYAGTGGGVAGDAFVEIHVLPNSRFRREGNDLHVDVPISLNEAVLGGRVTVKTADGDVAVKIPKGANTGTRLRLRGKGIDAPGGKPGDLYVRLEVTLPEKIDPELEAFVGAWAGRHPYDPRKVKGS